MILLVRLQFALQISNEGHAREGAEEVSKGRKRDKEGGLPQSERLHDTLPRNVHSSIDGYHRGHFHMNGAAEA